MSSPIICTDNVSSLELDSLSIEFLSRFRFYTAPTLGGKAMHRIFDAQVLGLAFSVSSFTLGVPLNLSPGRCHTSL